MPILINCSTLKLINVDSLTVPNLNSIKLPHRQMQVKDVYVLANNCFQAQWPRHQCLHKDFTP